MEHLTFEEVTFYYEKEKEIVSNINFALTKGEFHCFVGKSGCGKTTLLKLGAGLLQPTLGTVSVAGEKITETAENMSFVFQTPTLLKWKTVRENILLPISLKRKTTGADIEKAYELLRMMGMKEYAEVYPKQLSGGQQARVSIARALVTNPKLLFMDEPFAALDALTKEDLQSDLLRLCEQEEMTAFFITHDIQEAVYLADQITVMGKGKLVSSFENKFLQNEEREGRYSSQFMELCRKVRQELERG